MTVIGWLARGGVVDQPRRPPAIPQCCPGHRLAALDDITALVFNDTLVSFDRLVANGWTEEQAVDCLRRDYRGWLLGRLTAAVDDACAWLDIEVAA